MALLDEIHEQPALFRRMLETGRGPIAEIAEQTRGSFRYVVIAARGTSDNAARYAKYLWGSRNRIEVSLAAPSLYSTYRTPPRLDGALVVGVSQSGQSPDLVAVIEEAQRQGCPTLTITNETASPLAATADWTIDIDAGVEEAIAATKTYTSQLLAIALLSAGWDVPTDEHGMYRIPDVTAEVLETADAVESITGDFAEDAACAVLGRGFNRATAFEWALKLQEMTYTLAHPYSTADFRHGPIAVIESGFPVLAVAPRGVVEEEILQLIAQLRRDRGARTAVITNESETDVADYVLPIPVCPEWLSPIPAIVSGQLFAYHLAHARGVDPDNPRGLSKVTRTL